MRMWMLPPETMCRKHLLGEHVELHMLLGTMKRGRRIDGFLAGKLTRRAIWDSLARDLGHS